MTERRFPTDAEVDSWIADHMARDGDPRGAGDPAFDQAKAARPGPRRRPGRDRHHPAVAATRRQPMTDFLEGIVR